MNQLNIAEYPHGGATVYFVTVPASEENLPEVLRLVETEMEQRNATIVLQYLFGGRQFYQQGLSAFDKVEWPLMLLQGDACSGMNVTGCQFVAVSGADLRPVMDQGRTVGYWYETSDIRCCLLGDIRADNLQLSRSDQVYAVFEKMEKLLRQANLEFYDIARTWLYLNRLLEWYDDFNAVRTRFFRERGIFDRMVPASTGIGAGSAAGEAIVSALLAVRPKHDGVKVFSVPSPLQCPALDYKSSFARAVEIQQPGSRFLTISGTASIEPYGSTVHIDDTAGQIDLTMRVVDEILKSRCMHWNDVVRAIAYFKDVRETGLLESYLRDNGIPDFPIAVSHADVCRDDLLFEIELDAVVMV
ncbi:MAG: hypothetical protein JXR25_13515 [Pontiellaceae bacterium]|nr:hypothetical protein [Pontiellaceae bacterium]MBN2785834.1 hypothetical protein [Pontiellaceae bacterium]